MITSLMISSQRQTKLIFNSLITPSDIFSFLLSFVLFLFSLYKLMSSFKHPSMISFTFTVGPRTQRFERFFQENGSFQKSEPNDTTADSYIQVCRLISAVMHEKWLQWVPVTVSSPLFIRRKIRRRKREREIENIRIILFLTAMVMMIISGEPFSH